MLHWRCASNKINLNFVNFCESEVSRRDTRPKQLAIRLGKVAKKTILQKWWAIQLAGIACMGRNIPCHRYPAHHPDRIHYPHNRIKHHRHWWVLNRSRMRVCVRACVCDIYAERAQRAFKWCDISMAISNYYFFYSTETKLHIKIHISRPHKSRISRQIQFQWWMVGQFM